MTESTPKNIDEALHAVQALAARGEIVVRKNKDGQVGNQRTKYADLVEVNAQVLAALNDLGCIWKCKPTVRMIAGPNGQQTPLFVLAYSLKHVASDTSEDGDYPLPSGATPMQNGSAITYGRRYALLAVTGIAAEDDDDGAGYGRQGMAQRASARQQRPVAETAQRAQPPVRAERARPAQQPALPAPQSPAPAGAGEPHRGRGGLITEPMVRKLAITMRQALGDDPSVRKQFIVDMIGREVATSKDLTFDEGRALIDAFEKANQDPDTAAATVIDIYRRTTGGDQPAEGAPAPPARTAREQTRNSVLGQPAGPDDSAPWDIPVATPGGGNS